MYLFKFSPWDTVSAVFWLVISVETHKRGPVGQRLPCWSYWGHDWSHNSPLSHIFEITLVYGKASTSAGCSNLPGRVWKESTSELYSLGVWEVVSVPLVDHGCCACTFTVKNRYESNKRWPNISSGCQRYSSMPGLCSRSPSASGCTGLIMTAVIVTASVMYGLLARGTQSNQVVATDLILVWLQLCPFGTSCSPIGNIAS